MQKLSTFVVIMGVQVHKAFGSRVLGIRLVPEESDLSTFIGVLRCVPVPYAGFEVSPAREQNLHGSVRATQRLFSPSFKRLAVNGLKSSVLWCRRPNG